MKVSPEVEIAFLSLVAGVGCAQLEKVRRRERHAKKFELPGVGIWEL